MNPLAAIKYHYWGAPENSKLRESFKNTAKEMWRVGGARIYFVGAAATLSRDLIFGGAYGALRHELPMIQAKFSGGQDDAVSLTLNFSILLH